MENLKTFNCVSYDSMIIIYYCFNIENYKLIEFTNKSHILTEYLVQNNIKINIPSFLVSEIKRKDTMQMINQYISSKQITNIPNNPNFAFKLGLEFKFKTKFKKLLKKEWFNVNEYEPPTELYEPIETFFKDLAKDEKYNEFLKKKNRNNPVPSFEDIGLMAFSKEKQCPIISNDNDITFFAEDLIKNKLTDKIFDFNKLDIYNN